MLCWDRVALEKLLELSRGMARPQQQLQLRPMLRAAPL
jgi:hypothetical protein